MKTLPPALQAHLDDGTTTLAWCWRITRADGVTFGFTDHDRTLTFDGTEFEPESGLTASEVRSGSDLSVDAQDAQGVLSSDRITETDILDGRWDNASFEVWRRDERGDWVLYPFARDEELELASIDFRCPLADVFEGVEDQ